MLDGTTSLLLLHTKPPDSDPEKSMDVNLTMGFKFRDTNERYALEIRRGVVQFHSKLPEKVDFSMVADRDYMNRMLVGDIPITVEMVTLIEGGDPAPMVAIMATIDSGKIKLTEDRSRTCKSFSATLINRLMSVRST